MQKQPLTSPGWDSTSAISALAISSSSYNGQVSFWIRGVPIAGTGANLEEAENDFLDALIDYAELWKEELHSAPNHKQNAELVRAIGLCSDSRQALSRVVFGSD